MVLNVSLDVPAGHPFRDELEIRIGSDTKEGHDVVMRQTFPDHSFLVELLHFINEDRQAGKDLVSTMYLNIIFGTVIKIHPDTFGANH